LEHGAHLAGKKERLKRGLTDERMLKTKKLMIYLKLLDH
jgi:hypothetical protein